jgi:acyl-CoA synthetase (AMP-forming)/AMP-acid ligase II
MTAPARQIARRAEASMLVAMTIGDFLERGALVYGDRVGFVDEPEQPAASLGELSYARVAELARSQACALDALGIGFGERVAIVSHNAARVLLALYGVAGSGRVLVPVNFRLSPAEVQYIVEHSGARLLLVDPELAPALAQIPCERRALLGEESDALLYQAQGEPRPWVRDENATATINYTSGTTARPKGVQMTHRNLWVNTLTLGLHTGVSDRDVYLHTLPMFHCNGWGMPFVLTGVGAKQIVLRKVQGAEVLRRVEQHGVTLMCGAPAVVNAVLDAAREWRGPVPGRGRVRVVVAGAPPPTRTIERVETELGWEFIQIYGLTETSPLLTVNRTRAEWDALGTHERAQRLGRAGSPAIGVQLRVDAHGEVLARSNVVLDGYWRQPDASAAALAGGWFHTGDGGSMDSEGYLTISDRKKDVIITGGENVASIEVEDALFSHPAVAEVAVIGVPDEKWGETVKALVVLAPGAAATERELIEHCRARLAHYKCPTSVELRSELARTATGKLQKFKLRAPYWQGRTRQVS